MKKISDPKINSKSPKIIGFLKDGTRIVVREGPARRASKRTKGIPTQKQKGTPNSKKGQVEPREIYCKLLNREIEPTRCDYSSSSNPSCKDCSYKRIKEKLRSLPKQKTQKRKSVYSNGKKFIKISPYDRLQAIAHSNLYQQMWKRYSKAKTLEEKLKVGKEIRNRFGLPNYFPSPEDTTNPDTFNLFKPDIERQAKYLFSGLPIKVVTPTEIVYSFDHEWHEKGILIPHDKLPSPYKETLIDEKYVFFKIDLSQSQPILIGNFKNLLHLQRFVDRSAKDRKTVLDPWEFYSMYKEEKSLRKVTKRLCGVIGHLTYDKEADKKYKEVRRAYQKALRLIKLVESTDPSLFSDR